MLMQMLAPTRMDGRSRGVDTSYMYQLTTLAVGRLRTAVLGHTVARSVTILVFFRFLVPLEMESAPAYREARWSWVALAAM